MISLNLASLRRCFFFVDFLSSVLYNTIKSNEGIKETQMLHKNQKEASVIAIEEMAELTKVLSKMYRFGADEAKRAEMISEVGDVYCMLEILVNEFGIEQQQIDDAIQAKKRKLQKWSSLFD
jgi:short-subunit dehydrogenase involved in D-alanine esterification of teichoic acids